jgi:alpha/beta superfamily hydrolase
VIPIAPVVDAEEEVAVFGRGARLVGIVTTPPAGRRPNAIGVILLNAGVVHRVGPSRMYVALGRRLARLGFTTLRFDHSGIGDSAAREDHSSFDESSISETVDAMDWLAVERHCSAFVLVGLCSGTLTAFRVAQADRRVRSLALLTALLVDPSTVPEDVVATAANRRTARSYLVEKAASAAAWRRLMAGGVDLRRVWHVGRRLLAGVHRESPSAADVQLVESLGQLLERNVSVSFVYAEPTTVLEWFRMTIGPHLAALKSRGRVEVRTLRRADHTFTQLRHQTAVIDHVCDWVQRCT